MMNLMLYLRDVLVLLVGTRVLLRALQSNALALRVARLGRVLAHAHTSLRSEASRRPVPHPALLGLPMPLLALL